MTDMDEHDWLAQHFEENRTHLKAVAYRMLGSPSEADDALQEAWLRLSRSDTSGVQNPGGWLTTVVGRVCLDMLRSRKSRREEPLGEPSGARVPQPIASRGDGTDPEHEALLADSIGPALLMVLETLAPAERLAFVLHDMFGVPFEEIPRRSSTEPWGLSGLRAGGRGSHWVSRSRAGRSSRSTRSPTPRALAGSTWRFSTTDAQRLGEPEVASSFAKLRVIASDATVR